MAILAAPACVAILGIDDPPPIGAPDAGPPESGAPDAGPYANAVLADRPILYYRLAETSGPAIDLGGANARGGYGAAVARGVPGLIPADHDLSATFPGPDAGQSGIITTLEPPKLEPTGFITVECWVKADAYDRTMRIVSYGSDGQAQNFEAWVLQVNRGKVSFYSGALNGTGAEVSGNTTLVPGTHHIAGTYDG